MRCFKEVVFMVERNKTFQIVTHCIMILLCLMCVLPFVLLIMSSLADEGWLIMNGYSFLPAKLSLDAYRYLLIDSTSIVRGYMISIFVTVLGTCISLVMTTLMAYPLSRKDLPGRYFFLSSSFSQCCSTAVWCPATSCGPGCSTSRTQFLRC